MMLIDRLILGCGRLTGGATATEAEALVRAALDAGITHIDTAPSYGMGTAEIVVGRAVRRFGGPVRITAKLGSARDPHALARSWLRRIKRASTPGRNDLWQHGDPPPLRLATPSGHNFSRAAMAASLDLSRERLGRIDFLLLHDITAGEVSRPLLADLAELATSVGAQPGYASQAQWDADLDQRFGGDATVPRAVQCAMSPAWFQSTPAPSGAYPLFLHSIVKAGAALRVSAPEFRARLDRAALVVGAVGIDVDIDTARIAVLYVAAASAVPHARLIIASSHRARLLAVFAAMARIEHAGNAAEVVAALYPG